jgi:hypothetical protein
MSRSPRFGGGDEQERAEVAKAAPRPGRALGDLEQDGAPSVLRIT